MPFHCISVLYFYILLLISIWVIFSLFSLLKIVLDQDEMTGLGLLFCLKKKKQKTRKNRRNL